MLIELTALNLIILFITAFVFGWNDKHFYLLIAGLGYIIPLLFLVEGSSILLPIIAVAVIGGIIGSISNKVYRFAYNLKAKLTKKITDEYSTMSIL